MNIAENLTAIVGGRGHLQFLTFGWTDYLLFGGLLGISILIGIYFGFFGKKQDNTTEYLLGGKTMTFFPVSMSLIARYLYNSLLFLSIHVRNVRKSSLTYFHFHYAITVSVTYPESHYSAYHRKCICTGRNMPCAGSHQ